MKTRFLMICPKCGGRSEIVRDWIDPDKYPRLNCGDCLVAHVEIVPMFVEKMSEVRDEKGEI